MARFSLSNMSNRTPHHPGKCLPLDDRIGRRWERSRPMEFSHICGKSRPCSIIDRVRDILPVRVQCL